MARIFGKACAIAAGALGLTTAIAAGSAQAKVLASGGLVETWTHNCVVLDAETDAGAAACPYGVKPAFTGTSCGFGPDGKGKWTIRSKADGSLILRAVLSGLEDCDGIDLRVQISQFSGVTDDCGGETCFISAGASGPATTVAGGAAVIVATFPISPAASFILRGSFQVSIGLTGAGGLPLQAFSSGIQR